MLDQDTVDTSTESPEAKTTHVFPSAKAAKAAQALDSYERGSNRFSYGEEKSDHAIVVESMAARIRALESKLENQAQQAHEASEAAYEYHTGTAVNFGKFFRDRMSIAQFLEFEQYIERQLTKYKAFQPDTLNAYLWVFELTLDGSGGLEKLKGGLEKSDFERIKTNTIKYREQLRHWEKTGEEPTTPSIDAE